MRIVFWQNCLSPHQLPYITELIKDMRVDNVTIVTDCVTNDVRKKMGWDISVLPDLEHCDVYLEPTTQTVEFLLAHRQEDSFHFFSGIRGFKFVFDTFRQSLKYRIRRGIITERPNTFAFGRANGKPLWLHHIRFLLQDKKYAPYINFVFAMGNEAVNYFQSASNKWQVFPFAYCTQTPVKSMMLPNYADSLQYVYIGSLSWRKDTLTVLKSINENGLKRTHFTIIGNGTEREKLSQYAIQHQMANVTFVGTKLNSEIPSIIKNKDILILPSIYDGWGAVVNEALQNGLYVICSDRCGAKELLDSKVRGIVFEAGNHKQLADIMRECAERKAEIRENREQRIKWAHQCISSKAIAKYFIDCLTEKSTCPPWV